MAAVNRAQATLVNYPKTPANEDALMLLVEGYDKLGMIAASRRHASRAEGNIPQRQVLRGGRNQPTVVEILGQDERYRRAGASIRPESRGRQFW